MNRTCTLPFLLLTAPLFAQEKEPSLQTGVRDQDRPIVDLVRDAARAREQVLTQFHVRGVASFGVQREKVLPSPRLVHFEVSYAERRVLLEAQGVDVVRIRAKHARNTGVRRLLHPSGSRETYQPSSGTFSYTEVSEGDPRFCYDEMLPNEYLLSFCSSPRTRILAQREFAVASVEGEAPNRRARIRGVSSDGTQWMEFDVREDWNWLPAASRAQVRRGGEWVTYYATEITSVQRTRLGVFPGSVRARFLDPAESEAEMKPVTKVEIEFGLVRFHDVEVPITLNPEFGKDDPVVPGDTLYSETSFISSSRLAGRDEEIGRLTKLANPRSSVGAVSWTFHLWIFGLFGIAGLSVAGFLSPRRRRSILVAVGVLAVATVAVRYGPSVLPVDAPSQVAEMGREFRSNYLCGPDALCAATKLYSGEKAPHFLEVLRLVRPGKAGVSLERLRVAWSCTGAAVDLARAETFSTPPSPSVWHVKSGHFVTVLSAGEEDVRVFDPSRGVYTTSWRGLSGELSGPGLVPAPAGDRP